MGIRVDYTPVGEVYAAARRAGSVQAQLDSFQRQEEQDRFEVTLKAQQDAREFEARVRQEAASEDYQRTMAMAQAKSQIDFDSEIQMYHRKRMMMLSEIEQIQGADFLTQPDKDELAKRAYAKHFGATMGSTTMDNFLAKEQYKTAMIRQLQEQVDTADMSPEEARNYAAAAGIPYSSNMFVPQSEQLRIKRDKLGVRFRSTVAALKDYSEKTSWTGRDIVEILDRESREWREATPREQGNYERLKIEAASLDAEIAEVEQMSLRQPSQQEIETTLSKLGPQYSQGWQLAQAEGMSFLEFLQKIGIKGMGEAGGGGVSIRKPSLLEKISPVAAFGYMAGVSQYGKSLQ